MNIQGSLKARLLFRIMTPAIALAAGLAYWQYRHDKQTGEELFDRNLFSAAITISGDTATREGDALSLSTLDKINAATGGALFYHVSGFGGVHLTGFAYPPTQVNYSALKPNEPEFFDVTYRGEPVRAVALLNQFNTGNPDDRLVITVWQTMDERQRWLSTQLRQNLIFLTLIFAAILTAIWVGVSLGLAPLRRIERDLERKSPDDLSPLQTPVPSELAGIENRLNHLLSELEKSQKAQHDFISDAAHQLRNPATAVHALIETLEDPNNTVSLTQRIQRLKLASKESIRIAEQLLSLERLERTNPSPLPTIELNTALRQICLTQAPSYLAETIDFNFYESEQPCPVSADEFWLGEALKNIFDNAVKHGGARLSTIETRISTQEDFATVRVYNDGLPLPPELAQQATARFKQLNDGAGSGLGLSIVESVMRKFGGSLKIEGVEHGTCVALDFLLVPASRIQPKK